jgi:transcriptional regulator with XRE-family HTH domain
MNQIKIGKFIAEERKSKGYTQRKLADIIGISDKTISKWERGSGFPEVSLIIPLCEALDISVNELMTGERIAEYDYRKKAEENMVNLVKEAQESKKKIILSAMVAVLTIAGGLPFFIIAELIEMETWQSIILIVIGFILIVWGIIIACILDKEAGAFECPACHDRFVPDMKDYIMAPHTITKRRLRCPKCGETHWCKHVLTK